MNRKIIVAITGASGAIYAKLLLDKLQQLSRQVQEVGVVMSDNAKEVWRVELTLDHDPPSPACHNASRAWR